ncbi:MAG TPA: hypothetical protein VKV32_11985, partial [Stellaceae bacterium]|nr:hypothetical protein [Stellaceae bacterium]
MAAAVLCASVLLTVHAQAQAPNNSDPPATPFLRVDAGMHTAEITDLAVDGQAALIATASTDKTVRLWHADDGSPVTTLRVPIAPGAEGEINAVAVAPDGKHVLAGGATGFSFGPGFSLYLFDTDKQAMIGRLAGLPAPIMDVAYAPSGKSFAIGFAKTDGVRLYDSGGKLLAEDRDYGERVSAIAFAPDDRFAVSSYDGQIRLYDAAGHRVAMTKAPGGKRPASLAFSPDGKALAIGYDNAARVDVLAADTLKPQLQPRSGDLGAGALSTVGWTGDAGAPVLLAAGSVRDRSNEVIVRRWSKGGAGAASDIAVGRDLVTRLVGLPGGRAAFATADPAWGVIGANGKIAYRHGSPINDFRVMSERHFDVSPDGLTVAFSPAAPGNPVYRFDLRARKLMKLTAAQAAQRLGPAPAQPLKISGLNSNAPNLDGHKLALPELELARSAVALRDQVLIGTDFNIRSFDKSGHETGPAHAVPAPVWALANAGDDMVVAALGDGTLRWYDAKPGAPLAQVAALFIAADDRRWVIWTPEGFFDHADSGGKELVGYQLNRGKGDAPEWVGFDQLYRAFYAPDLVLARLQGQVQAAQQRLGALGDIRSFLQAGKLPALQWSAYCLGGDCTPLDPGRSVRLPDAIATQAQAAFVNAMLPPGTASLTLRYRITDRGSGIGPSDLFVNG